MADKVNVVAPGQCRVAVDSTSQLSLNRHKGKYIPLKIGATWQAKIIPAAPYNPVIANTGLVALDLMYLYAFDDAGDLTLEFDDTAHEPDDDTGVEVKIGDPTRTLLAMVKLNTGDPGTFISDETGSPSGKRWMINWFNRRLLSLQGNLSAGRSMTGFAFVEPHAEIRAPFLTWADEAVSASISGALRNNHATAELEAIMALAFDGTTPEVSVGGTIGSQPTGEPADHMMFSAQSWKTLSEGSHYATLVGAFEDNSAGAFSVFHVDTASSARAASRVRVGVMG